MIISTTNRDSSIRDNIQQTLQQVKLSGKANNPLVIPFATACETGEEFPSITLDQFTALTADEFVALSLVPHCAVAFYVDANRTTLAFTDDSDTNPSNFNVPGDGRTLYTPPDSKINTADGISGTFAQGTYYVTATFCDGTVKEVTYRNSDNLVFQSAIIASKRNPKFATSDNMCIIVPTDQRLEDRGTNDDRSYSILTFELYIQLLVFNWDSLSEAERLDAKEGAVNVMRNALYADRYRGGNCTLMNKNLNGTYIGDCELLPSKGTLQARVRVQTCSNVASTGF